MADSILPLVDALTTNIDDLSSALSPLSSSALSSSASKLPLLDKAKLYVLATYAIESTLFSSLRLQGIDPKSHPVFQELARVKAYFAKITAAETAGAGSGRKLDQDAAARFIKHGLAGNERYDLARKEAREKERGAAKRKFEAMGVGTHTRFDGSAKKIRAQEELESVPVVKAGDLEDDEEDGDAEVEEKVTIKGSKNGRDGGRERTGGERNGDNAELSKEEAKALRKKAKRERRRLREE